MSDINEIKKEGGNNLRKRRSQEREEQQKKRKTADNTAPKPPYNSSSSSSSSMSSDELSSFLPSSSTSSTSMSVSEQLLTAAHAMVGLSTPLGTLGISDPTNIVMSTSGKRQRSSSPATPHGDLAPLDDGEKEFQTGLLFFYGTGKRGEKSWGNAKACFDAAAKKGNLKAIWYLKLMRGHHISDQTPPTSADEKDGGREAKGVMQADYTKATLTARQFSDDIDKGGVYAHHALGICHEMGEEGLKQDNNMALYHYKKAADAGLDEAQINAGFCYIHGIGTDKNATEGLRYFNIAASQGNPLAMFHIGLYHMDPSRYDSYTPADIQAALVYIRNAARAGLADAQCLLGICILRGMHGFEKNPAEGIKWITQAADQGLAQANVQLGEYYRLGLPPILFNPQEALRRYNLALNVDKDLELAKQGIAELNSRGYNELPSLEEKKNTKKKNTNTGTAPVNPLPPISSYTRSLTNTSLPLDVSQPPISEELSNLSLNESEPAEDEDMLSGLSENKGLTLLDKRKKKKHTLTIRLPNSLGRFRTNLSSTPIPSSAPQLPISGVQSLMLNESKLPENKDQGSDEIPGATKLCEAIRKGDEQEAIRLVNQLKPIMKFDFYYKSGDEDQGHTPLHIAVKHGAIKIAETLLNAGADANKCSIGGRSTPLGSAADNNDLDMAKLLLSNHSKRAAVDVPNLAMETPLYLAIIKGHTKMVGLLLTAGADPNLLIGIGTKGCPFQKPLLVAAQNNRVEIVKLLLRAGTDLLSITSEEMAKIAHTSTSTSSYKLFADLWAIAKYKQQRSDTLIHPGQPMWDKRSYPPEGPKMITKTKLLEHLSSPAPARLSGYTHASISKQMCIDNCCEEGSNHDCKTHRRRDYIQICYPDIPKDNEEGGLKNKIYAQRYLEKVDNRPAMTTPKEVKAVAAEALKNTESVKGKASYTILKYSNVFSHLAFNVFKDGVVNGAHQGDLLDAVGTYIAFLKDYSSDRTHGAACNGAMVDPLAQRRTYMEQCDMFRGWLKTYDPEAECFHYEAGRLTPKPGKVNDCITLLAQHGEEILMNVEQVKIDHAGPTDDHEMTHIPFAALDLGSVSRSKGYTATDLTRLSTLAENALTLQYQTAARVAVLKSRQLGKRIPLLLTPVGDSAFCNGHKAVSNAISSIGPIIKDENVDVGVSLFNYKATPTLFDFEKGDDKAGTEQTVLQYYQKNVPFLREARVLTHQEMRKLKTLGHDPDEKNRPRLTQQTETSVPRAPVRGLFPKPPDPHLIPMDMELERRTPLNPDKDKDSVTSDPTLH